MLRAEAPCVKRRVVESTDAVHFHVGTTRIRSRHVVHGSWTALAGPAPLRRRRRAEMLVGGHVRCDCERHGTLIEYRSTTVDAQGARLQRSSCDRGPAAKCATLMRAAPVGSWAIAVCVCVDCLIYLYITAHHCTLVPVHTWARASAARCHRSMILDRTLTKGPSRAPSGSYVQISRMQSVVPDSLGISVSLAGRN
jgi:hypothetical protein